MTGGVWLSASYVVPLAATTALSVAAGRVLGPTELGRQSFIAFCEAVLAGLVIGSLTNATVRALAEARGAGDRSREAHESHWSAAAHLATGALVALALAVIGLFRPEDRVAFFLVAVSAFVNAVGWSFASRIVARRGWAPVAKRRLVAQLVAAGLGIVAVLAGFGIVGIFVANLVASLGLLASVRRRADAVPAGPLLPTPRALVSLWMLFGISEMLTQVVARRIEFFFLDAFSPASELAMYSIPFMLVSGVVLLPSSMAGAALPEIAAARASGEDSRTVGHLARALRVAAIASLPLAAALAGLGPSLVTVLYGDEFQRAADLVPLAALAIVVLPVGMLCSSYWFGVGRFGRVLWIGACAGAIDVFLALTLIPGLGALGAVIANLVAQVAEAGLILVMTLRMIPGLRLPWRRWVLVLCVATVTLAVCTVTTRTVGGVVGLVTGTVAGALTFAGLGAVIGVLPREDADWLAGVLPHRLAPFVRLLSCR
jgi:O-antigen/teichoic acid export membrane protein